jgi:choline-sulfatase
MWPVSRRWPRRLAIALVLLPAAVVLIPLHPADASDAAPARPNVLFIAIDDLNDYVGCLGGHPQVQTPHIDRLAARGTVFTNAHCQAPLCNPSRTSLLTGLRPSTTGVYGLAPWFRSVPQLRDVVTLPQYFAQHGYRTLTTGKIWHGGYPPQPQREAEFHVWGPPSSVGARPPKKLVETPGGNHPLVDWGTFDHRDEDKGDWRIATWAVEQLSNPPQEPFFLAVGFFLPHVPCYATQRWFDLYPPDALRMPPLRDDDRDDVPPFAWYLHWKLPEPRLSWLRSSGQWQPLVRSYLASISFMDSQVGRVLDALDRSGLADRTVVVLWSDHGWHLGEKGISGKNSLWERSTRVPLVFAGPGVARGGRCSRPAELLDVYPTLVELCGLPQRDASSLEGHSLVPQLRDAQAPRTWPAITTHNPGNHAVRSEHWRYIRYADGSEELYDLRSDPHEWHNLAADPRYAAVLGEHRQHLPRDDHPPVPGSAQRILVRDGDRWLWEGAPIDPAELEP